VKRRLYQDKKIIGSVLTVAVIVSAVFYSKLSGHAANAPGTRIASTSVHAEVAVDLSPSQLNSIKIGAAGTSFFPVEKETVGGIALADDLSVQVFPPYQGKLIKSFAELGDGVQKGQPLYSIDSPDLIQAESTLIGAAANLELTTKELARARELRGTNGVSARELEQAISDQQTAEGALKASRDAIRVFGKPEDEIDKIVSTRKVDSTLLVRSPISGQVTSFSAPPGIFVQPGSTPAPYSIADVGLKWMMANVNESDIAFYHPGQPVEVKVLAYPDRVFRGKISKIYETVDPNTHRVAIRSEIADPKNELRPGMLASFLIRIHEPVEATALPSNGIVRESDGTMTAWITTDRRHFTQRTVTTGLRANGQVQILSGVKPGELVVTDGAVFLSNMLQAIPGD
jgi:cobalt-zinc-cadmium efflux system membrane fusion protein